MPTTAQYRNMAREAENKLDWKGAAELYDKAMQVYPTKIGELAKADLAELKKRRDAAHATQGLTFGWD